MYCIYSGKVVYICSNCIIIIVFNYIFIKSFFNSLSGNIENYETGKVLFNFKTIWCGDKPNCYLVICIEVAKNHGIKLVHKTLYIVQNIFI